MITPRWQIIFRGNTLIISMNQLPMHQPNVIEPRYWMALYHAVASFFQALHKQQVESNSSLYTDEQRSDEIPNEISSFVRQTRRFANRQRPYPVEQQNPNDNDGTPLLLAFLGTKYTTQTLLRKSKHRAEVSIHFTSISQNYSAILCKYLSFTSLIFSSVSHLLLRATIFRTGR